MGASFRNSGKILALAGCDRLTIAPALLKELADSEGELERKLSYTGKVKARPEKLTEAAFLWLHHQDPIAVDKLAQATRNFAVDQEKLEGVKNDRGDIEVQGIFASVPYCVQLLDGPYLETEPSVITAF